MARGALWMVLLRLSVRSIGLISTIILARLLIPADFGLVAMATSIIAFLELSTAFSFDIPLIQKQDADRSYFDSAWTLNAAFYTVLTLLLLLLAQPAALFYQDARLENVVYVLAAGFFVRGFENIGIVYFRKELDFRKDFILMLAKKVIGFMVTIPLAFLLRSYWSLVAGIVIGNILGVALSYLLHPFRPRFSLAAVRELFHFSKWLVLNNGIYFLRHRSPDFIIGRISGPAALGIFTLAHEISTLPSTELVAPINRAVFPGYSKLAGDLSKLRESYMDVLTMIAVVALPSGFGIAAVAIPLVDLLLGPKWAAAAPIVGILALYGSLVAMHSNYGAVFNAIGKPHLITWVGGIDITILVSGSIVLGLLYGPVGVAAAYLGSTILISPVVFFAVSREINLRFGDLIRVIWRPVVSSLSMFAALSALARNPTVIAYASWLELVVLVSFGVVLYGALSFGLWLLEGRPRSAEFILARKMATKLGLGMRDSSMAAKHD